MVASANVYFPKEFSVCFSYCLEVTNEFDSGAVVLDMVYLIMVRCVGVSRFPYQSFDP